MERYLKRYLREGRLTAALLTQPFAFMHLAAEAIGLERVKGIELPRANQLIFLAYTAGG